MPAPSAKPSVSIVTKVRHARRDLFARVAASVAAQTFTDFEWVVVESPPHGCVGEVLAASDLPAVRHVRLLHDVTLASGRNLALQEASAELVAILDGDDENEPQRLARQFAFLQQHPDVDVVGGALLAIDEHGAVLGHRAYPLAHDDIVRAMRRYNAIAQPAVMLRRSVVLAAGGYRDYGEGACEDYELWSRLLRAGRRMANLQDVVLRYRLHDGANKTQRLRATLRDTLRVKSDYWRERFTAADHLRALGERCLLHAPPTWVSRWFRRAALRPVPPGAMP